MNWIATCPKGLENLLFNELQQLGVTGAKERVASVEFVAPLEMAYRVCLWSRLANRVLLQVANAKINDADDLYRVAADVAWEDQISPSGRLWVQFSGTNDQIRNSQFGAMKLKDAVVDRLRSKTGARPDINREHPDLSIAARLHRNQLAITIDISGDSLHRRGYRQWQGAAPLKENLAAALLMRSGWDKIAAEGGALLDPMCGSGTILLEGALMAANVAPGIFRESFGFERWLNHQNDVWLDLREEALSLRREGLAGELPEIRGYDSDAKVLRAAEHNIELAGLERHVRVSWRAVGEFKPPTHREIKPGLVLTNPPYGERLGEQEDLRETYAELGNQLKKHFGGWQVGIFTGNPDLCFDTGLKSHKKYKLFNGTIPSELMLFSVHARAEGEESGAREAKPVRLTEGAEMLANRLRKNLKNLAKWRKQNDVHCYRLYDADLPEYAVAIDLYDGGKAGQYVHLQEYRAPSSISEQKAKERLREAIAATRHVLELEPARISVKERRRHSHKDKGAQYQKQQARPRRGAQPFNVQEGPARLEVDLWTYLDTGLFLDHRPIRKWLREHSAGKRFLNLFCYTGAASVQAALGGAATTTSVDMSKTYLAWAQRNFDHNAIGDAWKHQFVAADCLQWLEAAAGNRAGDYDLIFMDPPTFSNSARMRDVLDIQRDHPRLIGQAMKLLSKGGTLVFSNNLRSFKMDAEITDNFDVQDITRESIDRDFQRNQKIHNCWLVRHR
ncbi:bifunctional 23S rRNA (guanine(2069)-N(7))-methyltransferase RlmK/23S rRNA (guanine(2445)-N(2))-methyltransferase RlmL [Biformimicrobium ophioploci]|uniref:Ribosomal RNA large subunit methyltransferase K/L n=1 Tax=Biformimicrobium ophioploci TaxID=3036711 RepID=A0ABQ6M1Z2_9GAMM|nr:bifunctional 23S rRNA (guanine(2069)-N(7))-methyltransferase RlmK/23S rRNA (guanine(2445)-N(2))-methyltransferase RlmL [Microbulbifer sp. NKW57]GMG88309.1 bifunctional 23S rRNA (guanine(2069)-N(7))-methyltransferase RlmK/23S rRNA (guanine(2445)-N(2))-methyltransferase RlmL [Microbulbifer sp. NKW57]